MSHARKRKRILFSALALAFIAAFVSSALAYYQKARGQWLGSAPTSQLLQELKSHPDDVEVMHAAARRLWEGEGKPKEALPIAQRLLQHTPNRAMSHLLGGYVTLANDLPAEALYHFERALELDPSLTTAHAAAGAVYLDAGLPLEALRHLEVAWNPRRPEIPVRVNIIDALCQVRRLDDAERLAREAMMYSPRYNVTPHVQLYRIYKLRGNPEVIRDGLLRELKGDFTYTSGFYAEVGFMWLDAPGDTGLANAEWLLKKARKVAADDPVVLALSGAVLQRRGQHQKAVKELRLALQHSPANPRVQQLLLKSLVASGQGKAAARLQSVPPPPPESSVWALRGQVRDDSTTEQRLQVAKRLQALRDHLGAFQICWPALRRDPSNESIRDLANRALVARFAQQRLSRI